MCEFFGEVNWSLMIALVAVIVAVLSPLWANLLYEKNQKLALVRELLKNRTNKDEFFDTLDGVPAYFGNNKDVMDIYEKIAEIFEPKKGTTGAWSIDNKKYRELTWDILPLLCKKVGLKYVSENIIKHPLII